MQWDLALILGTFVSFWKSSWKTKRPVSEKEKSDKQMIFAFESMFHSTIITPDLNCCDLKKALKWNNYCFVSNVAEKSLVCLHTWTDPDYHSFIISAQVSLFRIFLRSHKHTKSAFFFKAHTHTHTHTHTRLWDLWSFYLSEKYGFRRSLA